MKLRLRTAALPLLREALRSGEEFPPYFSVDDVARWLEEHGAEVRRGTLRDYLSDLVRSGLSHDAGRGWYCRYRERPVLDDSEVRPLVAEVAASFPLLKVAAWSTTMLNPWLHHFVGTGFRFLHVERDALDPVADHLDSAGWKVFSNPGRASSPRVSPGLKTVVLRPLHVHSPTTNGAEDLLPERVLVDLRVEVGRLGIMDTHEYHDLAARLAGESRLIIGSLRSYGKFRGVSLRDLFGKRSTSLFSKNETDRFIASK